MHSPSLSRRTLFRGIGKQLIPPVRQLSRTLISPNSVGMGKPLSRTLISPVGVNSWPLVEPCKFETEPVPNRFRLEKMGFLCYGSEGEDGELRIFTLDLGGGGGEYTTQVVPAVRIYGFGKERRLSAMCVSNSTLYIFEGRNKWDDLELEKGGRSVWKLDLSSEIMGHNSNRVLFLDDLDRVRDMHQPKCSSLAFPISISGHKDKILVVCDRFHNDDPIDAMELYDPSQDSWEILPKFPLEPYDYYKFVDVYSCNPSGDSGLMVHTNEGMFVMDLNSANRAWKPDVDGVLSGDDCVDFAKVKDRYVISPGLLCDVQGVAQVRSEFSSLDYSVQTDYYGDGDPCMFLVKEEEEEDSASCHTLVSQTQLLDCGPHRLLIDVCRADFTPLRNTLVRTLRFGFHARNAGYLDHALFQI